MGFGILFGTLDGLMFKDLYDYAEILRNFCRAVDNLDLSKEQIIAFCQTTPDNEELRRMYLGSRGSRDEAEYNFEDFVVNVLADTKHPVTTR